ncbi:MAG: hypothetical protein R3243_15625 [Arenibacter latericius]|nr:hypothetical protein [Arenibacter latericius]
MIKSLLYLLLSFSFIVSHATEKEILATVVFENLTAHTNIEGEFFVMETNQRIKVSGTQSFQITLPEKGKYQFGFTSNELAAYTYYPSKITKQKNTITVRLMEKGEQNEGSINVIPAVVESHTTDEDIDQLFEKGDLNFIIHGIDNSIPKEFVKFEEIYGVGLVKENCVVDPLSYKRATENNQIISDYLNKKYGKNWLNELPAKPFGIK